MNPPISAPVTEAAPPAAPPTVTEHAAAAPPTAAAPVDKRRKALLRFAISITVLNVVGHLLLGFEQPPIVPVLTVLTSYAVHLLLERIDSWAQRRPPAYAGGGRDVFYFLLPAHIAALACAMLIYTSTLWPYLFAVTVAAASKYILRIRVRGRHQHVINPSNAGIVVTLLLIPLVGFTPPYMFLNNTGRVLDVLIPLGVLMAGTMINGKLTGRLPLIMAWIGGYLLQGLVRSALFDDVFAAVVGSMTGVAFILFTNYMITDPGTTPASRRGQIVFGLTAAAVYGVLISLQVAYAIFFALVLTCVLRGALLYLTPRVQRWRAPETAPAIA